ncbi:DUF6153 family protein [Microbacterium amylolyticum]|uniref:DUF2946 domain-containing protein n=1 Tax=Microbacterium amylolyticum TaxID=936337 RepID=A0ABS4ZLE4_9MICO|nr:DUF6153 family protein [Microbacterium amylolyticum]MBP2437266.1 hypothetical protein [Microbacterium amylolyticum]
MSSLPATASETGLRRLSRRLLLGGVLAAAVILGVLAMHTLNLHGTPAAHASGAVSIQALSADGTHHGASATHDSHGTSEETHGACTHCVSGEHLSMAMACLLALLLGLLFVVPPRLLPGRRHTPIWPALRIGAVPRLLSRAPSLHVLCISRT